MTFLSKIARRVKREITFPSINQGEPLNFYYDLSIAPLTFDFAIYLQIADQTRRALGLKTIHVHIVTGLRRESVEYNSVIPRAAREWRIAHVLIPIIQMFDHGNTPFTIGEYGKLHPGTTFPFGYTHRIPNLPRQSRIIELNNIDIKPAKFTAPSHATELVKQWLNGKQRGRKIITISLRTYKYITERNSNEIEWNKFAYMLNHNEYMLIFIPDLANVIQYNSNDDFVFQFASLDLNLRMALYQMAYLNLGVSSGPMIMPVFSDAPYMTFKFEDNKLNRSQGWIPGQSAPWANNRQKWIWRPDSFENIQEEFKTFESLPHPAPDFPGPFNWDFPGQLGS